MKTLNYKIIYRNGSVSDIATFLRVDSGKFIFEYVANPKYEFPGFPVSQKKYESDTLWEQISFRVPNILRKEHPNTPPEELLKLTSGKLVTDHFEFILNESKMS